MRKARIPVSSFQFGEVSSSLLSRTDSPVYSASAQRVENFLVRSEGGVIKRGGFKKIAELSGITLDSSKKTQSRLVPFVFSDDEQYLISLEDAKVRAYQISPATGDLSLVATLTQDVNSDALPFDDTYLHEYTYAQFGDTLFICHQLFMPRMLVRTGLTSFQIQTFAFEQRADGTKIFQPYYEFHPVGATLESSIIESQDGFVSGSGNTGFPMNVTGIQHDIPNGTTFTIEGLPPDFQGNPIIFTLTSAVTAGDTTISATPSLPESPADGAKLSFISELTVSVDYFESDHVGTYLRYHDSDILIESVTSATTATGIVLKTLDIELVENAFRTLDGSAVITVSQPGHGFEGGETIVFANADGVGGISKNSINGTRTVLEIIDENRYTFTAGGTANLSEDGGGFPIVKTGAPTLEWQEQSFSTLRGFPAAVCFHENRLAFAGTSAQPDAVWLSNTANYFTFDTGDALDADSIQISVATGEVNQIRHLVSNRDLQIFAVSNELYLSSLNRGPLTPTNALVRVQTPFGSNFVEPQSIDGATVFVQKNGKIAREYLFSDVEAAYTAQSISNLSPQLIKNPHDQAALRGAIEQTESYMFMVNSDGTMSVFNSNRAEQRAAWTEFTSDISFKSVTVVDERLFVSGVFEDGDSSQVYVICELDTNFNLDVSSTYTGVAGVFDVSADFANGTVLHVVNGTDYYGSFTVANGNVDCSSLNNTLTSAQIGLSYPVTLTTNPLDLSTGGGPATGLPRGLGSVIVDVVNTESISVNGKRAIFRNVNDDLSLQRDPFTGKLELRLLGYSRDPQVTITQDFPLNIQVNGLVAEVNIA